MKISLAHTAPLFRLIHREMMTDSPRLSDHGAALVNLTERFGYMLSREELDEIVLSMLDMIRKIPKLPSDPNAFAKGAHTKFTSMLPVDQVKEPATVLDSPEDVPVDAQYVVFFTQAGDTQTPRRHATGLCPIDEWLGCPTVMYKEEAESFMWEFIKPQFGWYFVDKNERKIGRSRS